MGDDWEAFTVVIQLGAILAVVAIYFQVFWKALINLPGSADARRFAFGIILALLPSVVVGLYSWQKKFLDRELLNPATAMPFIAACWIIGGIVILVLERMAPRPRWFEGDKLPLLKAFKIGCCQILSIIPGVSRSGATILGGEMLGVERKAATLFTFYLAVPTMVAATVKELHDAGGTLTHGQDVNIAIGFVVSFIVAWFVIRQFLVIVGRYGLSPFGWYRIAAAAWRWKRLGARWSRGRTEKRKYTFPGRGLRGLALFHRRQLRIFALGAEAPQIGGHFGLDGRG